MVWWDVWWSSFIKNTRQKAGVFMEIMSLYLL